MQVREFEQQFERLKSAYGEKNFPEEREGLFWKRFNQATNHAFTLAVDWIILTMPPAAAVAALLDDKLRDALPGSSALILGEARMDKDHPIQPNAAELAAKYAPSLKNAIGQIAKPLPYDPKSRITEEEEINTNE